jgi:hypothetical protein
MRTGVGLLLRWVRGTEWRWFLDVASPAFFDVMPLGSLSRAARGLVRATADAEGFRRARAASQQRLRERGIDVRIRDADATDFAAAARDPGALGAEQRRALGQRALEIYFGQLFAADTSLLDLRAGRLALDPHGGVLWAPRSAWVRWQGDFLAALRDLYAGFYRDDEARFAHGLAALHLEPAAEALRAHFGSGDQRAVRFATAAFQASFHEIFVRCRDAGVQLHPDFLPLGIALACLYDGLEALGPPLDVRDAFERAAP